jgi:hypothetical protein
MDQREGRLQVFLGGLTLNTSDTLNSWSVFL